MSRTERLDAYLEEHDLAAVWFADPDSFAWLTGADNVVARYSGVAAAGYDGDAVRVVTSTIEANRFREEETPDLEVAEFVWYESSLAAAVAEESPEPAAADFEVPG
ncbi:MAG: aminopeptidase P family N-terminal domain-containing protein, partial [Halobacteriales archaeon]